jgi:tetratricopeptide (TPR) repeat protein
VVLIAPAKDLDLQCDLHDWQFDEAIQGLELKIQSVDLGSVARFVRSIWRWLNTGAPTVSGVAELTADKTVVVRLSASGGPCGFVAVAASTEADAGVDSMRLSAERAVFKLLYRLRYPADTQAAVDGLAALRQGVTLFAQFAATSAGAAADVKARTGALQKAAYNFGYARASLTAVTSDRVDVRPPALLAEGVAYALLNQYEPALERFRQLEDWPSTDSRISALRNQARYNSAVILRRMGKPGAAVLELTNVLGERPLDLGVEASVAEEERLRKGDDLNTALQFSARLARAAALAEYDDEAWVRLPRARAEMVIQDSKKLLQDLAELRPFKQAHDDRIADYFYTETLLARGRILLSFVKTRICADLYLEGRPTGLKRTLKGNQMVPERSISEKARELLADAIDNMQRCEEHSGGSAGLFYNLAEAKLLVGEYEVAEQYARQASLVAPEDERGYYLAAESCYLSGAAEQLERSKRYARAYHGEIVTNAFRDLLRELGLEGALVHTAAAS